MSAELPPLNVEWTNVFKRDIAGMLSINLRDEVLRILNMLSQTTHKSLTFLFSLSALPSLRDSAIQASSMVRAIDPWRGISGRCSRSNHPDSTTSSPSGLSSPEAYSALKPIMMFDGNGHVCDPK